MEIGAELAIISDNCFVVESFGVELSVTVALIVKGPAVVGVPLMTPVEPFKVNPPGKPDALQE